MTSRGLSFAGPSRFASNLLSSTVVASKTLSSASIQLFIIGKTDDSDLFSIDDEVVDPLEWSGTMGWRWYTGYLIYALTFIMPLLFVFASLNLFQLKDTNADPSSWWKCGLYCALVLWLVLNSYNFITIRATVRVNHSDFNPSWLMMLYSYMIFGIVAMGMWTSVYYINNEKLFWIHGAAVAIVGPAGPVLQCYLILPKSFSRREFWEVVLASLASTTIFLIMYGVFLLFSVGLLFYFIQNKSLLGSILGFIPFITIRIIFDHLAIKVCSLARFPSLRIIFINTNALMQRLMFCWAISSSFSIGVIIFAVLIEFLTMSSLVFFVCGPLKVHTAGMAWPVVLGNWIAGKKDCEKLMTKKEKSMAISERKIWVYFTVLHSMGETILPVWQMVFWYLNNSTKASSASMMGFEKISHGFPIINPHILGYTVLILGFCDLINFIFFTYIVRKNFPNFEPFKFLNVLMKKFGMVLILSVITLVLCIQCMMLIDCKFDISIGSFRDEFGV